jgi:endonuclease III
VTPFSTHDSEPFRFTDDHGPAQVTYLTECSTGSPRPAVGSYEDRVVAELLARHGRTYASEAGIRLQNTPSPLFRLLCLSLLSSARIRATTAVAASRSLAAEGWRTPERMVAASWTERVQALNRAGYARYDEKTSRMLGDTAALLIDRYRGDLRRLRDEAGREPVAERRLLQEFPGIGEVGAAIFSREVQTMWLEVFPFADRRALTVAGRLGLGDAAALARRVDGPPQFTVLVAALVRCGLARHERSIMDAVAAGPTTSGARTPESSRSRSA